jgi:hypothetical protein
MRELKLASGAHLYETDFYAWSHDQAERIRALKPKGTDWANVAEEIESLARRDKREVAASLRAILKQFISWRLQPEKRTKRGIRTVFDRRDRIERILRDSPTLARMTGELLQREYPRARDAVLQGYDGPKAKVPAKSPFTIDQMLDPDYWP